MGVTGPRRGDELTSRRDACIRAPVVDTQHVQEVSQVVGQALCVFVERVFVTGV